jgi:hypothetical protein
MTWWRNFKLAWSMVTTIAPYVPEADLPEFWNEEDGLALQHFLNSATGIKYRLRLTNFVLRSAVRATQDVDNPDRACGIACGIALGIKMVDNHLPIALAEESTGDEDEAAVSFAEKFAA